MGVPEKWYIFSIFENLFKWGNFFGPSNIDLQGVLLDIFLDHSQISTWDQFGNWLQVGPFFPAQLDQGQAFSCNFFPGYLNCWEFLDPVHCLKIKDLLWRSKIGNRC